jgi:hypothetical protein
MARVWHVAMVAAMVAMLVLPVRREVALLELLLFTVGLAWCAGRLVAATARRTHVRLAVGFVAMGAMLAPVAFAPVSASASMPGTGMTGMTGMHESHAGLPAWLSALLMLVMLWSCWPEGLRVTRSPASP